MHLNIEKSTFISYDGPEESFELDNFTFCIASKLSVTIRKIYLILLNFDEDYFEFLIAEIGEIRLSERRFYQKITDIYATSIDYNRKSPITIKFLKQVQNKMYYVVFIIQLQK